MQQNKNFRGELEFPVIGDYLQPAKNATEFRFYLISELQRRHSDFKAYILEIEEDPVFKSLDGEKLPWGRFTLTDLTLWYVWRINEVGYRRAKTDLKRLKNTKTLKGKYIAPLVGFRTTKSIKLINGFSIEPLEKLPIFDGKISLSGTRTTRGIPSKKTNNKKRSPDGGFNGYGYNGRCALTYSREYKVGTKIEPTLGSIADEIRSIAIVASSLEDTRFAVNRLFFATLDSSPFGLLSGGSTQTTFGFDEKTPESSIKENYQIDIRKLRQLLKFVNDNDIPPNVSDALYYLSEAKFKKNDVESYSYLGMALEIALANEVSKDNRDSLSSTIRRRGAWLVGTNYKQRDTTFTEIGKIYNLRSAAVHSGGFDRKKKKLTNRIKHQNLCSQILQKLMVSGKIDFESLVLGGSGIFSDHK